MNLIDFLITYLAVGSAFGMRAYFLNRHRPFPHAFRAVILELLLWLPVYLIRLALRVRFWRSEPRLSAAPQRDEIELKMDRIVQIFDSRTDRNRVQELFENYVAIRSAISDAVSGPSGQFELFEIAGNRNGNTGTACLYRRNLEKLGRHSERTALSLIETVAGAGDEYPGSISFRENLLLDLFADFGDDHAILLLKDRDTSVYSNGNEVSLAGSPVSAW